MSICRFASGRGIKELSVARDRKALTQALNGLFAGIIGEKLIYVDGLETLFLLKGYDIEKPCRSKSGRTVSVSRIISCFGGTFV